MKTFFLILLICSIPTLALTQIQMKEAIKYTDIGIVKGGGITKGKIFYYVEDNDTTYILMYRNGEYSSIIDYNSISFNGGKEVLDQLYTVMKSVFSDENKKNKDYKQQFSLGETEVSVSPHRTMGTTGIWFWTKNGYFVFSEKEVDKLFGY